MPRKAQNQDKDDDLLDKLNAITKLLQVLFILEGIKAGINKGELRRILAIDKRRISRISKHVIKP